MTKTKSAVAKFVGQKIHRLRTRRTQAEIAKIAGLPNPNFISMIVAGTAKVPLDRVPALARALECDPGELARLALEQFYEKETIEVIAGLAAARNTSATLLAASAEMIVLLDEIRITTEKADTIAGDLQGMHGRTERLLKELRDLVPTE